MKMLQQAMCQDKETACTTVLLPCPGHSASALTRSVPLSHASNPHDGTGTVPALHLD